VEIIKSIKINAIWPLHDNTQYYLKKYGLFEELKKMKNLEITPLVNYEKFIFLMAKCKYLVTDGGSIQEESLVFKKPCIILRKATERQEGLSTGINFLTKLDVDYSKELIDTLEKSNLKTKSFKNPYGEKGLSKKIVSLLTK
jgi:UDP-N-acetylglucosamine 2-epimerase